MQSKDDSVMAALSCFASQEILDVNMPTVNENSSYLVKIGISLLIGIVFPFIKEALYRLLDRFLPKKEDKKEE